MLNYISNSVEHNETIVFIHGIASTSETPGIPSNLTAKVV